MAMKKLWPAAAYLNHRRKAVTRYRVHSPFVYELIEKVFRDRKRYSDYRSLNRIRKRYKRRKDRIETMDFGSSAGDKSYMVRITTVGQLVRQRTHTKKQLELLYRIARWYKPDNMLEFGTAAGISALYLGKGSPESRLITMEGCMGLASVATKSFKKRNLNVEVEIGDFDAILEDVLERIDQLDLVFFDGNHRLAPTLNYFSQCLTKANENSVFLFDDIHWSPGMSKAWKTIKKDKRVTLTIDLFWLGMVFFRKDMEKQDFVIRY
jgi:predicted O-methyltransferase YrrM